MTDDSISPALGGREDHTPEDAYAMGQALYSGNGVTQDFEEAARCFRQAYDALHRDGH